MTPRRRGEGREAWNCPHTQKEAKGTLCSSFYAPLHVPLICSCMMCVVHVLCISSLCVMLYTYGINMYMLHAHMYCVVFMGIHVCCAYICTVLFMCFAVFMSVHVCYAYICIVCICVCACFCAVFMRAFRRSSVHTGP